MAKYSCFVISAIGESGSKERADADDLMDLIIRPALQENFEIHRGDDYRDSKAIPEDVVKRVQDADLCICDISRANLNVFYELGRRDETGKDVILLRAKDAPDIPADLHGRRYVEYDLTRAGIREAMKGLHDTVAPFVKRGFEGSAVGASLGEIASILSRVERTVARMDKALTGKTTVMADQPSPNVGRKASGSASDRLRLALLQKNIPMAEQAMEELSYVMERNKFLDQVVELVAAMGSERAGRILLDQAAVFFDSDMSLGKKIEYLGSLISYANKQDKEADVLALVEKICEQLLQDAESQDIVRIYNQLNRIYYGMYGNTENEEWLDKAIASLKNALEICEEGFLYYNLATCLRQKEDYEGAREAISKCLELDKKEDSDHLELACRIYHKLEDARFGEAMERLGAVDSVKATLLQMTL